MTREQFDYFNKLKLALEKIANYPSPVNSGWLAYKFRQIAKEALEKKNEN